MEKPKPDAITLENEAKNRAVQSVCFAAVNPPRIGARLLSFCCKAARIETKFSSKVIFACCCFRCRLQLKEGLN